MFGLGFEELIVILAILLLLFGGTKLPQLSRSLAESIKEIRKGFKDEPASKSEKDKEKK